MTNMTDAEALAVLNKMRDRLLWRSSDAVLVSQNQAIAHFAEAVRRKQDVAELIAAAHGLKFDVYIPQTQEVRDLFDGAKKVAVLQIETLKPFLDALARVKGGE